MANGYQLHILIGNLGADPKVHTTRSGQKVCNFDIAVNEKNSDGTEVITWYSIAAWNGLGEVCAQYLKKGRSVMVEGTRMTATGWIGRDNNLYTRMELTANQVKFLDNGTPASNGGSNGHYNNTNAYKQRQAPQRQAAAPQQRQQQRQAPQRQAAAPQRQAQQPQHNNGNQQQAPQWDNLSDEEIANQIPF